MESQHDIEINLLRNPLGYFEVANKPSPDALKEYYAQKYYQQECGNYQKSYTIEERNYFKNKIYQNIAILNSIRGKTPGTFLDIGCGEGFALSVFLKERWDVTGIDYSEFGCQQMNPDCTKYLISGDIYNNIKKLINDGHTYDVIWLTNVLEHVPDPKELLKKCIELSHDKTVLVCRVPNDFSQYQLYLVQMGYIPDRSWVAYPDHLSYFNYEGLNNILPATGWHSHGIYADFPIDLFLLNDHSNYIKAPKTGTAAHKARIGFENLIHNQDIELVNSWYRLGAKLGIGRQLTSFSSPMQKACI